MLTRVHILLTYSCPLRCKHCFVFAGPQAKGTFTSPQVTKIIAEAVKIGTIEWIFFEGGEPFYHYPLLLQSIKKARDKGFSIGVITNGYFARTEQTAVRFLRPLQEMGVTKLCVSEDLLHYRSSGDTPAKRTLRAAIQLGLPASRVRVEGSFEECFEPERLGDEFISNFQLRWRGRATDQLTPVSPFEDWKVFKQCPKERLAYPTRLDIDAYGNVQICQGISIGNTWETLLSRLVANYRASAHPICGPLQHGGPVGLAEYYQVDHDDVYADACHFCYTTRLALIDRFPTQLVPRQVYGL